MNNDDRKYRFHELMATISMLPDVDMESGDSEGAEDWVFPNLTKGLADKQLRDAVLAQVFRNDSEFAFKAVATISNSALASIRAKQEADDKPSKDDLEALSISANILWGIGQTTALMGMLGMIGSVCGNFELDTPDLAKAIFRGNDKAEAFGKLDPISILEGTLKLGSIKDLSAE